ncbi:unnamed protein product [Chrysoparadoxa australica]
MKRSSSSSSSSSSICSSSKGDSSSSSSSSSSCSKRDSDDGSESDSDYFPVELDLLTQGCHDMLAIGSSLEDSLAKTCCSLSELLNPALERYNAAGDAIRAGVSALLGSPPISCITQTHRITLTHRTDPSAKKEVLGRQEEQGQNEEG